MNGTSGKTDLKKKMTERLLLLDGAMGTQLIARGISGCMDYASISSAEIVYQIHLSYLQAGSDCIISNTFGANKIALRRHKLDDKVVEINKASVSIAQRAAGDTKYVLGDIGPTGDFLEPIGTLKPADVRAVYREQASVLFEAGVDGFVIETMTAIDEIAAAIEGVKSVSGGLPVFASMSFDRTASGFKTSMGVDVWAAVSTMVSLGVDAIGFNCGSIPLGDLATIGKEFVAAANGIGDNTVVFAEPNAGQPQLVKGKVVYTVLPDDFAAIMNEVYNTGVHILGGCCGTAPEHIKAISDLLRRPK